MRMQNSENDLCLERLSADEYLLIQAYRACPEEIQKDIRLFAWGSNPYHDCPDGNNVIPLVRKV